MPVIPKERIAATIKPDSYGLEIGDKVDFKVTAPHKTGAQGLYSLPVSFTINGKTTEDNFPLNVTHTRMFVTEISENSDDWVGAKFRAAVVPQNNPQKNIQVKSWSILLGSIVAPTSKKK